MVRVAILGVGLIGGSLARVFRQAYQNEIQLIGYDSFPERLRIAEYLGIIDEGTTELAPAVHRADFVFLCVPVEAILDLIDKLSKVFLPQDCVVSDVGSTKVKVVETGTRKLGRHFIGGHPMTGSHRSGVENASESLFENAYYVLTPTSQTSPAALERLTHLLSATRSVIIQMAAEEHDRIVGAISHLPHIVAAALVRQVAEYDRENHWYADLAAGGFRDLTRIASSNPVMWRDILMQNDRVLLEMVKDWSKQLKHIKTLLRERDEEGILRFFQEAQDFRDSIPDRKKGILPALYECYVDILDRPGIIGEITTLLGEHEINLTNLLIIENREESPGVLRLSFRKEEDLQLALDVLKNHHFHVSLI